jgi:hemerythrin superfamily protein
MCAMSRRPPPPSTTDLFGVLQREHQAIRTILEHALGMIDDDPEGARTLVHEVRAQLLAHAHAEERSLYLELERTEKTGPEAHEAREEHGVIEVLLEELAESLVVDDSYRAKLKVMTDILDHHVDLEEHSMFPKARAVLDGRLDAVTRAFQAEKERELARLTEAEVDEEDDELDDDVPPRGR